MINKTQNNYNFGSDDNVHDDIALIKINEPFDYSTWGQKNNSKDQINPVCLPGSSFQDEGNDGFVIGLGLQYQKTCRTNGGGPERYKQCAPGVDFEGKHKQAACLTGSTPMEKDEHCYGFYYKNVVDNQEEVSLMFDIII